MKKILLCFTFLLPGLTLSSQTIDPMNEAMASLRYTLKTDWNQFNLFDLGGNPAWYHERDSLNWLQIWNNQSFTGGKFHRTFDPEKINTTAISFAGAKHVNENQTFWGKVTYFQDQLIGVNYALEREPYAPDPFILADTSSGGFRFWGPGILVIYSQKLTAKLNLGAELDYLLDSAVRDRESMVRIVQRNLITGAGLTYRFSNHVAGGITYRYENFFDLTEVPNRQDGRDPVTFRYRGYIVKRRELRDFNRNALNIHHLLESQWLIGFSDSFEFLLKGGYEFQYSDLFDGKNVHLYEAYWERNNYNLDLISRCTPQNSGFVMTGFASLRTSSDWSKHYRLPVLITDQTQNEMEAGLGIGYVPLHRIFRIGAELSLFSAHYRLSDYIGHANFMADITDPELRLGGEYFFKKEFSANAGARVGNHEMDGEMPYCLDSYIFQELSLGLTRWQKNYNMSLLIRYAWQTPAAANSGSRNFLNLLLNSKFNLSH